MDLNVVLFNNFETLDVFGPVEVFGKLPNIYNIDFFSMSGGYIENNHNIKIITKPFNEIKENGILLIPGGIGTRDLVNNREFLDKIIELTNISEFVLTVCTGSLLLAKTEVLNGKKATTNKMVYTWVAENNKNILWEKNSRWTIDGKFYTSAGVSAGIDMAFAFIYDKHGSDIVLKISECMEYLWNNDRNDIFSYLINN